MKQIIQYQKTGEMSVANLPVPMVKQEWILVQNVYSLISTGTEKTSVETAQASMLGKAKSRPDLVKQVLENVKREGLIATYDKVKTRLDNYKELGYSCAGVVLESGTDEFKPGDRVACGGAGANHSEFVLVPKNLTVKIPDNVDFDEAAFTTLGSITMQGVRQADLRVGEYAVVIGLGLLGLITVQILKAGGCKVAGLDISDSNFEIAKKLGCDLCAVSGTETNKQIESFTKGYGSDAVIITAGTKSNEPVEFAIQFARKKSKVVVVGAVGMNIPRSPFYEKEIDFRISCSYGPGRYDVNYEEKGEDYPIGYVRWTENRNMQSVLSLISEKKLDVKSLISHKIPIEDGLKAYDIITGKIKEKHLGVLIEYPVKEQTAGRRIEIRESGILQVGTLSVGFIGAGNFAQSYLIPPLKNLNVKLTGVCTSEPVNSKSVGEKFGFDFCTTDYKEILNNENINTVFVATRHDSHGKYVVESLKERKNVYVEKPMAINAEELERIREIYLPTDYTDLHGRDLPTEDTKELENIKDKEITNKDTDLHGRGLPTEDTKEYEREKYLPTDYTDLHGRDIKRNCLMVGFNRRFSKSFRDIKEFFGNNIEPFVINYRVHAGFIPNTHWIQYPEQGGRIIGEVCHFVDTIQFLTGSKPKSVYARCINSENKQVRNFDNVAIIIEFEDGSVGNILYLANGDSSVPKEYCEVYSGGRTAVMNNFRETVFYANGKKKARKYDGKKGHKEEVEHFVNLVKGKAKVELSFESIYLTTLTTFKIMDSLRSGKKENISH